MDTDNVLKEFEDKHKILIYAGLGIIALIIVIVALKSSANTATTADTSDTGTASPTYSNGGSTSATDTSGTSTTSTGDTTDYSDYSNLLTLESNLQNAQTLTNSAATIAAQDDAAKNTIAINDDNSGNSVTQALTGANIYNSELQAQTNATDLQNSNATTLAIQLNGANTDNTIRANDAATNNTVTIGNSQTGNSIALANGATQNQTDIIKANTAQYLEESYPDAYAANLLATKANTGAALRQPSTSQMQTQLTSNSYPETYNSSGQGFSGDTDIAENFQKILQGAIK